VRRWEGSAPSGSPAGHFGACALLAVREVCWLEGRHVRSAMVGGGDVGDAHPMVS
jgi:hypothetical protein